MHGLIDLAIRGARAGRGRFAASFLLAVMALPIAFPDHSPFTAIRLAWFDRYQTVLPRERKLGPVTVVDIDEESLRRLGQWPWPRTELARLIERIGQYGALAIGLDMILPEADHTSPEELARRLPAEHGEISDALRKIPAHDTQLATVLRRHPVVLGVAGLDAPAPAAALGLRSWPIQTTGGPLPDAVRHYRYALASLPNLQAVATGQALLSVDLERGVVRRVPLIGVVANTPLATLSIELLRVAIGAPAIDVEVQDGIVRAVNVGDLRVPTQPRGEVWLHFSSQRPGNYVPAVNVLDGKIDPDLLKDQIVIVALTGLGLVDYKTTPQGQYVPGVDAHAQMIEAFIDRRFLLRPDWLPIAETVALAALAGILIWRVPGMRRYVSLAVFSGMLLLISAAGFALFNSPGLLVDAASMMIALSVVFASLIASALVEADRERRAAAHSLNMAREASARVAGELEAARRIQLGVLPDSNTSFPDERRFDLCAAIEPARAVGGDLYDFFMLDADRLFAIIADVSGKGIPASLFMTVTKALTKSIALRAGDDVADILSQADLEISRDNPESFFVTAFACVLDVNTGLLRYWTAGHDSPYLRDAAGIRQIDASAAGPPLCVLADYDYPEQRLQLARGDTLVLFTDGITEAEDRSADQFGKTRLARCLERLPPDTNARGVLEQVLGDVQAFVAGAPASDDLTLLVLRWVGPDSEVLATSKTP